MHDAPSVSFPVGRCLWCARWRALLCLLALGSAAAVAWGAGRGLAWAAACALLGIVGAVWTWRLPEPVGVLHWRAGPVGLQGWWWSSGPDLPDERVTELSVLLDLQAGMLLQARLPARRSTLWLSRQNAPHLWVSLRQAVWHQTGTRA